MDKRSESINACVFTSANDEYAVCAAISLLSVREHNKSIPLYLLSSYLSDSTKSILKSLGIEFIELDLSHVFTQTWDYPLECYYLFAGPEIFQKRGFSHSIYMDGDILCRQDPVIPEVLENVCYVAGVSGGNSRDIFGDDFSTIENLWEVTNASRRTRVQSGVVFFNNQALLERNFLKEVGEIFKTCINHKIPRKGDDSLLALYCLTKLPVEAVKILPGTFNYIPENHTDALNIEDVLMFHFTGSGVIKPWKQPAGSTDQYSPLAIQWLQIAKTYLSRRQYREYIQPDFVSKLKNVVTFFRSR